MKLARSFVAFALCFSLVSISSLTIAVPTAAAQDSKAALQRGYRTGYSDGYMSGYRDVIENAAKSFKRHPEYKTADRAYSSDYGRVEDYRDGYRQGFEKGYDHGYAKNAFDARIPDGLAFRGDVMMEPEPEPAAVPSNEASIPYTPDEAAVAAITDPADDVVETVPAMIPDEPDDVPADVPAVYPADTPAAPVYDDPAPRMTSAQRRIQPALTGDEIIIIPAETELVVELVEEIDTKVAREGDAFKARVVSPSEIAGAIIEGRVAKNRKPGRLKRRAELVLSFDRIVLAQNRWSNFNAFIMEVLPVKGDNVKRIDNEGTVEGQRPYKSDSIKLGASTGTGLVIGAIVGGPVGAAVGAGVGAAFGVGAVVVERGKYIQLAEQQQLRIKTAYETQIR